MAAWRPLDTAMIVRLGVLIAIIVSIIVMVMVIVVVVQQLGKPRRYRGLFLHRR